MYEVVDEDPFVHFLTEFRSNEAQKGLGYIPKRCCDTKTCEIAVGLRLMTDRIEPVSFQVPRKSEQFAEDIYPDTYAGVPMMESSDYLAGSNKDPATRSMRPDAQVDNSVKVTMKSVKSAAQLEKELDAAHLRIKELEELVAKLKQ